MSTTGWRIPISGQPGLFAPSTHEFVGRTCQQGGELCHAGRRDGIVCPHDSCDIDDGIRPPDPPKEPR